MELFKQFTQMLEDFIISIVDKRMAERQPQPAVAVGLEEQVLKLLNQEGEPDRITPVEQAIRKIAADSIPHNLATEDFVEGYCADYLDDDQVEQKVFDALRDNSHETTDIIHDNLDTRRIRNMLTDNDIVEDILFDSVMQDDRFYSALVDNLVHAITNSETLDFKQRVREVVAEDHTLKDELRTIVKAHFADNGEFAARVCQIIRNKL